MSEPVTRVFDTPSPVHLYVENGSGRVVVTTSDRTSTEVRVRGARAAEVTVQEEGDRISIIAPKNRTGFFGGDQHLDIEIHAGEGSHLVAKTGSADLTASGPLGDVRLKSGSGEAVLEQVEGVLVIDTGSGNVRIAGAAGDLKIRSGSGDVALDRTGGSASISTGSGDIRIAHARGPVVVKTGSGDLEIGEAESDVASTTASGDVLVRAARRGKISAKGASGDICVGVPVGTPVWTDVTTLSGRITSTLQAVGEPEPGADHLELRATTMSGDIALVPA